VVEYLARTLSAAALGLLSRAGRTGGPPA